MHNTLTLTAAYRQLPAAANNVLDTDTRHTIAAVGALEGSTARLGTW